MGHGHGHGHGDAYTIPKPCIYDVDEVPELKQVQQALERQGLRDPWLRNEVWRYNPAAFGTKRQRFRNALFPGFFYGLGLTVLTLGAEALLGKGKDHHQAHAEGGEGEGGHH